ncbi:hypothetical protein [Streptomyces fructofermentans]|uniref:Uncharacterized protein n=1 Tax=Streptomyces fructofermentans TaxID=152141 RepID=A0A918NVV9_9ACTN|nr:hypothetical protein [Streptomyces fructofermentans]GGX99227.1 hypothetical protein GCM10010515_76770 [Streptomyces fructofermentans]
MSTVQLAADVGQFTTVGVTTAGFALGLALLGTEHYRWYRGSAAPAAAVGGKGKGGPPAAAGGRSLDPKAMIAYWFGMVCGILMVACPGGLANMVSEFFRWAGNGIGGLGMSWLTGQNGTQLAQGGAPHIDGFGAVLVTALFLALIMLRKTVPKAVRGKWWKGVFTSCLLCITTGTAALIAGVVVSGANDLARMIMDAAVNGTPT